MSLKMAQNPHHLVLVPGLDGTGNLFDPFLAVLPSDTEATVVSFPHDKRIYDPDLFAVIRNVIPWNREYVLVAESTSSPLAMRFAAAQWENIRAIVLVSGFVSNPMASANWATAFLSKPWYEKPATPASVRKNLLGGSAPAPLVDAAVTALRTPWPEVLGHRIELIKRFDAREALQNWQRPVLYLRATQDEFIRQESLEEITTLNPAVQVATVPGPHLLLQANPRGALDAIRQFLQSLDEKTSEDAA